MALRLALRQSERRANQSRAEQSRADETPRPPRPCHPPGELLLLLLLLRLACRLPCAQQRPATHRLQPCALRMHLRMDPLPAARRCAKCMHAPPRAACMLLQQGTPAALRPPLMRPPRASRGNTQQSVLNTQHSILSTQYSALGASDELFMVVLHDAPRRGHVTQHARTTGTHLPSGAHSPASRAASRHPPPPPTHMRRVAAMPHGPSSSSSSDIRVHPAPCPRPCAPATPPASPRLACRSAIRSARCPAQHCAHMALLGACPANPSHAPTSSLQHANVQRATLEQPSREGGGSASRPVRAS